ncbi:MAG: ABC transporter ATP-binding protein [Anaerolineales bacterium]|nr:ABC transporter ATP-binding protein [Anaerolineales bacterium]
MSVKHNKRQKQEFDFCKESSTALLCVKDLSYTYPDGRKALEQITFSMNRNEKIALLGPNGAGKSTLILNIHGLIIGEGDVTVGGLQLQKDTLPFIRGKIGLVFQNPDDQLFSPTVYEDVAFGPLYMGLSEEEIDQRVNEALLLVGMADYRDRVSFHLSAGEKKRVAIATVLSMKPDLLILDEPTAGLDPQARRQLIRLLEELPIAMLVATHDLWMVKELFPRTIMMDRGQIVADKSTQNLLTDIEFMQKFGFEMP